MKKILLLNYLAALILVQANAQDKTTEKKFGKLRVTLQAGPATSFYAARNNNISLGFAVVAEPQWAINDKWRLGIRLQQTMLINKPLQFAGETKDFTLHAYCLSATHFFKPEKKLKWYAGLGIGGTVINLNVEENGLLVPQYYGSSFTALPKFGFEYRRLLLEIYSLITSKRNSNCSGMMLGFIIGRRKKGKSDS